LRTHATSKEDVDQSPSFAKLESESSLHPHSKY
jgi:hypothetical protein